jgi:branched-subunit amino acid transport protein
VNWNSGEIVSVMVLLGVSTFVLRLSFIHWFGARPIPPALKSALRFVPASALAALILPAVVYSGDSPGFQLENFRLFAAAVAAVVAWKSRSVLLTLVSGLGLLWLLNNFLGS